MYDNALFIVCRHERKAKLNYCMLYISTCFHQQTQEQSVSWKIIKENISNLLLKPNVYVS